MTDFVGRLRATTILALGIVAVSLLVTVAAWAVSRGRPDGSFGSSGIARLGGGTRLFATAAQSDGKVVAVGARGVDSNRLQLLVVRFTTRGRLDSSFHGGQVTGASNVIGRGVAIQRDGKIVVAGQATDQSGSTMSGMVVERFNKSGSVDGRFGSHGVARAFSGDLAAAANAVALQSNGRIVAAGTGSIKTGRNKGFQGVGLARFNTNGSADGSFGSHGSTVADLGRFSAANGVVIQRDGKIVVGGSQRNNFQTTSVLASRFSSRGGLDRSFAGGLFLRQYASLAGYSAFNALALQSDGKVVLAGAALDGRLGFTTLVVRLSSHGGLDGRFGSGGAVKLPGSSLGTASGSPPYGALGVVVSSGEIFAAGWFDNFHVKQLALWGLHGNGALDHGFGSGGRTLVPGPAANIQANALALVRGGNLVVAGDVTKVFGGTHSGFVGRFR